MQNVLDSLLYTLNRISVCGKDNLERLNACIETVEKLREVYKTGAQQNAAPDERKV
jgi:hypothetical protein